MKTWWNPECYSVSKTKAYFITIILVALFSLIRIWPLHMLGSYNPYLTYYPAIIMSAIIGGFFAGLLATSMACLIVTLLWWLLVNEPFLKIPSDWLAMILFAFSGILISSIAESMRRANERMQTKREQLEFSLNASQQGYWDLNLETGITERSLLHDQIFGYTSLLPEWTYELFLNHLHPDDTRLVDEAFKSALAHQKPWEFQFRIYRADDKSIRWLWATGEQVKIGKNNHMLGLVQDITERKNTELAVQKLTNKVNALLEATPDCLIISNKDGEIVFANKISEKTFGYTSDELMGQKIEFLIPTRYLTQHMNHRQHYFEKPGVRPMGINLDLHGKHKDGHEFPVEISLSPIETEEGLLVLAAVRDITDRKKNEFLLLQYAAIIESADDAILSNNLEGVITSWNGGAERIFGYTRDEVMGQPILMLIPEEYQHREMVMLKKVCEGEKVDYYETVRRHEDGKLLDISLTLSPMRDQKGFIIGASMVARDITKLKQAENALKVSELRFRTMAEAMPQVVWITRSDGWNIYFNQQWVDYTGLTLEESYGHGWNKPFHPDDQQRAWNAWQHAVHNNGKYSLECRLRRKDGIYRWWLVRGVPLHDESGNIIQWFGTCTDINDIKEAEIALKKSQEKLKHLAEHDPLTGLINRTFFEDRIEQAILLTKRQKEIMAICFVDLDDFKQINDQYGHAAGDLLLCAATERLQTCIRDSDTLARLGGDEFALILLGLKEEQDVVKIVKEMIQRFSEDFLIENKTLNVTLSIGISLYPRDGHQSLIEKADSAMYYVKNHGKNNFKLYDTSLELSKK